MFGVCLVFFGKGGGEVGLDTWLFNYYIFYSEKSRAERNGNSFHHDTAVVYCDSLSPNTCRR